jgi:probable blue pigment (indigoidine) exporter
MFSPGRSAADLAITALVPLIWGATYIVTTELLPVGHPLLAGAVRSLPAGLVLLAVTGELPRGSWWWKAPILGLLNIGLFFALLFVAASRLPGGVAASVGACQPIIATLLAVGLLRQPLQRGPLIAAIAGALGVGLLVLRSNARLDTIGLLAAAAGAVSMATGVVLVKAWGRPGSVLAFTSWQLISGGVILLPLALVVEGLPSDLTLRNLVGYLWFATVSGPVAYAVWFRGIALLPVATSAMLGLLSPVCAAILGWVLLRQTFNGPQLAGLGIALASIAYVQRGSAPPSRMQPKGDSGGALRP